MREIETLPEETIVEILDFAMYLKNKRGLVKPSLRIAIKDAFGIFRNLKGIDTTIERDEEDRV